ncbi:hypothetical protein [Advenella alkanexedens]|uniref:hypothetical protein n=1 Tax=Advenella alkanexedens TaxID=1481665 RepID=UPI0026776262|nr:hypothetical protein [Advenella alkanexedens]WKU18774.1 hypothetical protein Q3V95_10785 [Advenella alkanexedens]
MKTYEEWCKHYDHYDPESQEAKDDYAQYIDWSKRIKEVFADEIRLKNTRTCYGCKAFVMEQYTSNCLLGFKQERGQPKERCFKPLTNTDFIKIKADMLI